jgi:hypothetical protein
VHSLSSATVAFAAYVDSYTGDWKYETDFRGDFRFLIAVVDAY